MRGADESFVRDALDAGDPLPGTAGFAGEVDGCLVRDVLGRQPLFSERGDHRRWSVDRTDLDDPRRVPAGVARDSNGDEVVWRLPDPPVADADVAVDAVRDAVLASVRDVDDDGLAVAFSGGLDSGLVAAGVPDAPLYVAGFEGSHDVAAAIAAADAMDRDLHVVEFTHADLKRAVPKLVSAIGRDNPMDIQIALPLYLTAERAATDGYDRLAVGQGADELFGGYSKVVDPAADHRVDADTVRGATREVIATLPDQLERDVLALRAAGVEPVAPLLHDRVVDAALRLPAELLATADERKVALRRAATDVLPESVRTAEKKAVQYGTYAARELDRLARQDGFKRRMDDHVGQYVRSLCEE
ncbi:asparagine synthase (glutamine-hydrolysing) [Halogranum amylolyticum]|uniref:Asparagine synthase (Glutamine-hydrolysing) n=1 Tax=Halogranum amylolyticum TaxID=660520 RepID=A0A1H8P543_9EURY|nr:asparagine synthase-related protein [Halogranum amylolyticum]SEO36921.1 asparagine synthase (glutamine-hydrolysing) [Halogranum amylolyticum]